jgi:ribosomal protein L11 methyltransferase
MKWYEIKILTTHEAVEAVSNLLFKYDIGGVVIEDPDDVIYTDSYNGDWDYIDLGKVLPTEKRAVVKGYVSHIDNREQVIEELKNEMKNIAEAGLDIGDYDVHIKETDDADWANEWKKYYKPFRVGESLVIVPTWETFETKVDDVVLTIDPSGAFGSGTHETTFTCMEAIEKYQNPGDIVFDIGCGSGILAVASALLGASEVTGVDFSRTACVTARENVAVNQVEDRVKIVEGNLADDISGKADLFVANIIADVIIELSDYAGDYLKEDGYFIASGIINGKYEAVCEALNKNNFEIVEIVDKGEWHTIISKKVK